MNKPLSTLSALSVCISMALSQNAFAAQAALTETAAQDAEVTCPADISALSADALSALPESCLVEENALPEWLAENHILESAGALAALGAVVAIANASSGGGSSSSSSSAPQPEPQPQPEPEPKPDPWEDWDVGNTIEGDDQENKLDEDTSVGEGEVGNMIIGNNTNNTLEGNTSASDGGIGNVVEGNNTSTTNEGDTNVSGEGSVGLEVNGNGSTVENNGSSTVEGGTGTVVNGNDANVNNNGDTSVSGGGTGTAINGDGAQVDNSGDTTVSGEGSVGLEVNGNGTTVVNEEESKLTVDGGTGTVVNGNDANIINNGETSVSGGGTGTVVNGDNASISNSGDTAVSGDGSVGTVVGGNNSNISQSGDLDVSEGGTGIDITGNNNKVSLNGDMKVTGGATGVNASGNRVAINNDGHITVADSGSVGLNVSSDDATLFNKGDIYVSQQGTGAQLSGDRFDVTLHGTVKVNAEANRQAAKGVIVSGSNGILKITGDVNVTDNLMTVAGTRPDVRGIDISGNNNQVVIDGAINLKYAGLLTTQPNGSTWMSGMTVSGEGNNILLSGGLNLDYYAESNNSSTDSRQGNVQALLIEGKNNTVTLSGKSEYIHNGAVPYNRYTNFVSVAGEGSHLTLDENFDFTFSSSNKTYANSYGRPFNIFLITSAKMQNFGTLGFSRGDTYAIELKRNSLLLNHGYIYFNADSTNNDYYDSSLIFVSENSIAINSEKGLINVVSVQDPNNTTGVTSPGIPSITHITGITVNSSGNFENNGKVIINGQGAHGIITSSSGYAVNNNLITLNAMSNSLDEDGEILTESGLWGSSTDYRRGTAMLAQNNSQVVNSEDGEIRVHNAGMGMVASGGTAINQGTITLTADNPDSDGLYALAARDSGVAINDTNGVININTDKGQAFYTEGNGLVINRGTVNYNGSAIDSGHTNWGDQGADGETPELLEGIVTAQGESRELNDYAVFMNGNLASHGELTLNNKLKPLGEGWLLNTGSLSVTEAGDLQSHLYNTGHITSAGRISAPVTVNEGSITYSGDNAITGAGFSVFNLEGGSMQASGGTGARSMLHMTGASTVYNNGVLTAGEGYNIMFLGDTSRAWNDEKGVITLTSTPSSYGSSAVSMVSSSQFYNLGEINIQGDGTVGFNMTAANNVVVNAGTLNVGTEAGRDDGTNGTGLVGVKQSAANVFNNTVDGVINVWADNSFAFEKTNASATLINNGEVNIYGTGSGIYKGNTTANEGDDRTIAEKPVVPSAPEMPDSRWNTVSNYTVGTNADGSAGTLSGSNLLLAGTVSVDTGFVAGTSAREVTFTDVFKGSNISGEENIGSTTVVWSASAGKNAGGNVDVTMTKNDYAAVITDGSLGSVASALDNAYTSNALFSSLNVSTASALNHALKQVSGAQAKSLNREARVLGQRFNMLADAAPVVSENGLSFNVVAKGDKRAEMDNKVTYDMMALRQQFETGAGQVAATYGMARLSGTGGNQSTRAGDNGLIGGYSQFFGLHHSLPLSGDAAWENSLRADLHQLDSRRHLSFEGTSRTASASGRQQHLSLRSEGVKTFSPAEGLSVAPFAGVKLRHHTTGGYQERGAGEFDLSMNRYSETAVDVVSGLRLNWAGSNGWGAQATLEAGPNLSYSQSQRTASLRGMQGQQFRIEDGKKAGGVNGQAALGVNYQQDKLNFGMNAYQWKEDGASDQGFSLNVTRSF